MKYVFFLLILFAVCGSACYCQTDTAIKYAPRRGCYSINDSLIYAVKPLYIINGSTWTGAGNPFASINTKDILSIKVLSNKQARRIYGSVGKEGAIIVNTK